MGVGRTASIVWVQLIHILLLEDNPADVLLFGEALRTCSVTAKMTAVRDAEQGVALLQQDHFKPDLIVLDLNMSRMSGHDFLKECCTWLDGTPCVVFSSSLNVKDRDLALELGARDYVIKPAELYDFVSTVHGIVKRWGPRA